MSDKVDRLVREQFRYHNGSIYWRKDKPPAKAGNRAGTVVNNDYILIRMGGFRFRAERVVFFLHHGYWAEDVEHINGDPLNNRIENLRECKQRPRRRPRRRSKTIIRLDGKTNVSLQDALSSSVRVGALPADDPIAARLRYHNGNLYWRVDIGGLIKAGDIAGTTDHTGRATVRINGEKVPVERVVYYLVNGRWPRGSDHDNA